MTKAKAGSRAVDPEAATWGCLVGWFSELVSRLDRGDLAGAIEAQATLEREGFKVTFRRRSRRRQAARP